MSRASHQLTHEYAVLDLVNGTLEGWCVTEADAHAQAQRCAGALGPNALFGVVRIIAGYTSKAEIKQVPCAWRAFATNPQ